MSIAATNINRACRQTRRLSAAMPTLALIALLNPRSQRYALTYLGFMRERRRNVSAESSFARPRSTEPLVSLPAPASQSP